MKYEEFIQSKFLENRNLGFEINPDEMHPMLFDWQKRIVQWAAKKGKSAIFGDCGVGKTIMQVQWAKLVVERTGMPCIILAPLGVTKQTVRESSKIDVAVQYIQDDCGIPNDPAIYVTNYERIHKIDPSKYGSAVFDESSIVKNQDGKTRNAIISAFASTPYKLCCTATAAPNDWPELGSHAEILDVMTHQEMLAEFFVHDGGNTQKWRLNKWAAEKRFWEFVCSWAVCITKPSDIGYSDEGFSLPPLHYHEIVVPYSGPKKTLFTETARTLSERRSVRRDSIDHRCAKAAKLVNDSNEQWVVWTDLNAESERCTAMIPDAVQITGTDSPDRKADAFSDFADGKIRVLVTKPSIGGFGMNWQNCGKTVFVGLSDSWEKFYQSKRRFWRFGRRGPVDVYVVIDEREGSVLENIRRKEEQAAKMRTAMVRTTAEFLNSELFGTPKDRRAEYVQKTEHGNGWTAHLGDSVDIWRNIPSESIHYTIFSPPFADLYTYSNSERDIGNVRDMDQFLKHFGYLVPELYRTTIPGRLLSFHCMNLPAMKSKDGYIGLKNFRDILINLFESCGFIFHSEVVIPKDPLIEATRTKAIGLMHKQAVKDSARCRQGIPDYLIQMVKPAPEIIEFWRQSFPDYLVTMARPGENPEPVSRNDSSGFEKYFGDKDPGGSFHPDPRKNQKSHNIFRRYAQPIWMDINQTRTLNGRAARDNNDEKHICPLQLDVVERAIHYWTNEGDTIADPFAGIFSTGYCAVRLGRKSIMGELKPSYFLHGLNIMKQIEREQRQTKLFETEAA